MSFFGVNFSIAYVVLGLLLAIIGGTFIQALRLDDEIKEYTKPVRQLYDESETFNQRQRLLYAKTDTLLIVKNVYKYVLIGVGVGALIHNVIPQATILSVLGEKNPLGVVIAVAIGIPIYADIFGALPIAEALYMAGVPAGTILALMMSVTALSLPSIIMLSNVLSAKLLGIFVAIVSIGIIVIGYVMNIVSVAIF